jgi:hypothetical protein
MMRSRTLEVSQPAHILEVTQPAYILEVSQPAYILEVSQPAYILEVSQLAYILEVSLQATSRTLAKRRPRTSRTLADFKIVSLQMVMPAVTARRKQQGSYQTYSAVFFEIPCNLQWFSKPVRGFR